MKRNAVDFVSTIAFVAVSMMTACSGEVLDETYVEETTKGSHWQRADIKLYVDRINFDAQAGVTRSVDDGWKDGDRIYLILKDKDGNNVQAYVEYDTATTSWGQVEYDGYKSSLTCTAPRTVEAYFFDGAVDVTSSDITFDATTGVYVCMDGIYTYPDNGNLEVSISLAPLTSRIRFTGESGTNFSLSGMTTYTTFSRVTGELTTTTSNVSISVNATDTTAYFYGIFTNAERPTLAVTNSSKNVFVTVFEVPTNVLQVGHSGYLTVPTEDKHRGWKQVATPATEISLNKDKLVIAKGQTATLQTTLTPANATSDVVWSSSNASVVTVSDAGVLTAIAAGNATITAVVEENANLRVNCSITVLDEYEYVDLGLTSGTLWATMNLGASSPEDYGDYFAWGEVNGYDSGKTSFYWDTYKYCNGSSDSMTKYCTSGSYGNVDNKTELELSDDAAHHNWKGNWHMPSSAQFQELIDECTWTNKTQNGVWGFQVKSKKNANSLFLPAAGYYYSSALKGVGEVLYYWSRDKYSTCYKAEKLYVRYNSYSYSYIFSVSTSSRYEGQSIRPVLASE